MRILVTGGSGWIGGRVCAELERRGHIGVPFDARTGGDIRNAPQLTREAIGCDSIIHLAGLLGTHELFDSPHEAVDVNVHGTLNVLHACLAVEAGYVGITMPDVNPSLYSATKNCGKHMAEAYRQAHELPVAHVIAYNAFGPGQAHGPGHPQKILPTFATRAWAGLPIPIWGDGELWCDLVHVDDVARVLVDALDYGDGETFDAGTGKALTVREVAAMVHDVTGDTGIEWMKHRPGERRERTDDDFAQGRGWDLLGWRPTRDAARFKAAVESYRDHPQVDAYRERAA